MADNSPTGRAVAAIAAVMPELIGRLDAIEVRSTAIDTRTREIASQVAEPGRHKTEEQVTMPLEPCVVLSDGEVMVVVTDRTCDPVATWARQVGPIARSVMVARLRAVADHIDREGARA